MAVSKEVTIDISEFENVDVQSFTIRRTTGRDALAAIERAVNPKGGNAQGALVNAYSRSQMIADAIVAVDGAPVVSPYLQWEDWGTRTQFFVEQAYDKLNGVTNEEAQRFLAKLGRRPAPTPAPIEQP